MERNEKLTFNDKQVRNSFKAHYCKEYVLPSGKPSGYYKFPITDEEINKYMEDYQDIEKPKGFLTWSEWALFVSLRLKYGINYLKEKQQQFLSHIDTLYAEPKEDNNLEEKLLDYCDMQLEKICVLACDKWCSPEPQRDTAVEKNFRSSLDNADLDVLY